VPKLAFDFEWIDPADAKGPELRATWARLQISVDGQPVTRLIDDVSRSVRSSVFLPIYPLAEWLVTNWWFLLHETQAPGKTFSRDYWHRHNLRYAGEGFALPALSVVPTGATILLDWRPVHLTVQRVEFTEKGAAYIDVEEFRRTVADTVTAVLGRLAEYNVRETLLAQEWEAITNATEQEGEFCAATAALGLDPYAIGDPEGHDILEVSESLPSPVVEDFFAAAEFQHLRERAHQVLAGIESSRANRADLKPLKELKGETLHRLLVPDLPWHQGYRFARILRERLSLDGERLNSLNALGGALRLKPIELQAAISQLTGPSGAFDVVVDVNPLNSPGFAISTSKNREEALRFAFCRGIFEYLTTPPGQPLLVTRALLERQQRNRAFAAEFLVPAASLKDLLRGDSVSGEEIEDLAAEFGVSPLVVRHQLENHHLARILDE